MCLNKGGLGFKQLDVWNSTLLAKQLAKVMLNRMPCDQDFPWESMDCGKIE